MISLSQALLQFHQHSAVAHNPRARHSAFGQSHESTLGNHVVVRHDTQRSALRQPTTNPAPLIFRALTLTSYQTTENIGLPVIRTVHPAWVNPRRDVLIVLLHRTWIFLLRSQLLFPGIAVFALAVLNPLLHPAVVDDRNSQDALSTHPWITDHRIVLNTRRRSS